jgi:hypothetical protein
MIKMKTTGKIGKVNIVLGLLLVLGSMIAVCAAQDAIPEAI